MMAATAAVQVQVRLAWYARLLLNVATKLARIGLPVPHRLVVAVTNRAWSMRIGEGEWRSIRINDRGEVV